ncbi:hypothetical protein V8E55_008377 [Tylopilus felleus]
MHGYVYGSVHVRKESANTSGKNTFEETLRARPAGVYEYNKDEAVPIKLVIDLESCGVKVPWRAFLGQCQRMEGLPSTQTASSLHTARVLRSTKKQSLENV